MKYTQNLVASQDVVCNEPFLHAQLQKHSRLKLLKSQNSNLVIFLRVGAFEQLFSPGRGGFEQTFSKNLMPGGCLGGGGGMLKL